ncbi:TonB-dependent receptor [Flavobacterium inviolabile]|uniref:TonB-dependent receptor n=1 Tax=Flavobacterium inviolabile TaxID=2748320 RepID=UPI0015AAB766|nr:TonB-dependent receptor [Flavobacterium inviolabile]
MNRQLVVFLLSFFSMISFAQNRGTVKGNIVNESGVPIPNASITVLKTTNGTSTNNLGEYSIPNLPYGNYTLRFSMVGYQKSETKITVNSEVTTVPVWVIKETVNELDDVVINEKKTNKFTKRVSATVSKMPLKDIENPQVYVSVPAELLKEQVVTNFNDALKNATGVTRLWESTGRGGDGAQYFSMRGFSVQPSMLNGLPYINNGTLDLANTESIEVIKGPSGTLYGSSLISYGGLINVVTKKPYETFGGELAYNAGTYGLNRITADVNTPLGKNNDVFFRVNAAYTTNDSFQDAGFSKSLFVAPSITYKASDKLTFMINTEFFSSEGSYAPMLFLNRNLPLSFNSIDLFDKNYKNSFTSNDLSIKNPNFSLQAQMLYKISDSWTSQTALSRSTSKSDGYYSYLFDRGNGNEFDRYITKLNAESFGTDIQQNFIGDFKIAGLRNRMVVGLDYYNSIMKDNSTGWVGLGFVSLADGSDTGNTTRPSVDNALAASPVTKSTAETETYAAYISDVINITPTLSAMGSLRVDHFVGQVDNEKKGQTALSPKFGLLYQPLKDKLSVFANYMNGFKNILPQAITNQTTQEREGYRTFDPEKANQMEFGVKSSFFNNKLSATVSYYDIKVSNIVMNVGNGPATYTQGGEVTSKGVEVSVVANPVEGLNLIAGFSKNDSEVTKDLDTAGYIGMRPESAGPETLVNFWANYTFNEGSIKGFGFGFGGNYASEQKTLNRSNIGTFSLPSYTIVNSSLSYSTEKFHIILKMNNITNEKYYSGWSTVSPQALRSITAGLTYKF